MPMRRIKMKHDGTLRFRHKVLIICIINAVLDAWIYLHFDIQSIGFIFSSFLFWLTIIIFPKIIDHQRIIRPRNYIFSMFFITIIVSPPVLYTYGSLITNWILNYNSQFWDYFDYTLILWDLSFVAYAIGLTSSGNRSKNINALIAVEEKDVNNAMLYSGILLILIGVAALSIGAGSFGSLLAIKGQRELAVELINVSGKGRYLLWSPCIPYGACLVWFYFFKRYHLDRKKALIIAIALYIPFIPFYSYTSGRATTLIPLIMLITLYYKYCYRFPLWWLIIALIPLPSLLGVWALYRLHGFSFSTDETIVRLGIQVVMDSFSRLDVSIAAIAGFIEGDLPYFYGQTILAALTHPLPSWIIDHSAEGGTMAMAKAIFVDISWDEPSGMATPLMIEGYLNFGLLGVILLMFCLGLLTKWTETLFDSKKILVIILGIALMFNLPFGAALQIIAAGAFWKALFPFLIANFIFIFMCKICLISKVLKT